MRNVKLELVFVTVLVACGCIGADDEIDEPLVISHELLVETFEECAADVATCLEIPEISAAVDERIDQGEWVWPEDSAEGDELAAARSCSGRRYTSEGGSCASKLTHKIDAQRVCGIVYSNKPQSVVSFWDRGHCSRSKPRGLYYRCCSR